MNPTKARLRSFFYSSSASFLTLLAVPAFADGESTTIETVVVTGSRMEATTLKKDAPNVTEVQSLQAIRDLPDVTAAEALERVPGISMESDSGEGRFINIRGLDADL